MGSPVSSWPGGGLGITAPKEKYSTEEESGVIGLNVFWRNEVVKLA